MEMKLALILALIFSGVSLVDIACERWGFAFQRKKSLKNYEGSLTDFDDERILKDTSRRRCLWGLLWFVLGVLLLIYVCWLIPVSCSEGTSGIAIDSLVVVAFCAGCWIGFANGVDDCKNIFDPKRKSKERKANK